jgi:AraC family transcriptional regulator of adaptative response/methylated-DNA-[protein]-cysteine methyltransferase
LLPRAEIAQRVCEYIDAHLEQRTTLALLSREVGLSPFHLQRVFKQALGITPRQYQQAQRLQYFKQALRTGSSIATATYAAGFASSSRLYDSAAQLGMQPKAYRQQGAGILIRFAVFDTALGNILVAATPQGLCRVALGDSAAQLETALRAEFACAEIQRDDADLKRHTDCITQYLHGSAQRFDLPLDIRATAFQRRVWQLLQTIPYGETRSYSELAAQLGNPKAARAVATACANNPLAIVVPCHRVVQKSGALAGFRWGLERKAALLASEREENS